MGRAIWRVHHSGSQLANGRDDFGLGRVARDRRDGVAIRQVPRCAFVVLIDSLGRPVASGLAEQTSVGDDRLRRAVLQDWLEGLRMVTTDGVAQRRAIDRVYAHIASGTNAQAFISEFYRNDPPFKRAQTGSVSVEVKSVLPTSDRSFEVDWIETSRDLYGNVNSTDHWKGSFTVALNPPTEERQARINPLGLYVTAASWAKVL